MPRTRLRSASIFLFVALASCGRARPVYAPVVAAAADTRPIWIGELGSWSGRDAHAGLAEHRGFQLAVEAANEAGGVRGRPLRVLGYDDQGRIEGARAAGRRLTVPDKVALIAGGTTAARAEAAAQAAGDVPLVCATCPAGPSASAAVIGLDPGVRARAEALADQAVGILGLKRFTLLVRAKVASDREHADAFRASLEQRGVVADERAMSGAELEGVLASLARDPPEAIFVACSGSDAAMLCSVLKRRGVASQVLTPGAPEVAVLPADQRGLLDGVISASMTDPDARSGPAATFAARYEARFGEPAGERAWLGHLAGLRLVAALERAREYRPADVRAALDAGDGAPERLRVVRLEQGQLRAVDGPRN